MPYTILDAMKDEVNLLIGLEKEADRCGYTITSAIYREQCSSLRRVYSRVVKGIDYTVTTDKSDPISYSISATQSSRKTLEEEYPALQKAAEQYDLIKALVDSTPKID